MRSLGQGVLDPDADQPNHRIAAVGAPARSKHSLDARRHLSLLLPTVTLEVLVHRIAFYQLPLWVRIATALTLFNTWVIIAEFVIDRYGIDEYLPFYRYGDVCLWDIAVVVAIAVLFVRASRVPRGREEAPGPVASER